MDRRGDRPLIFGGYCCNLMTTNQDGGNPAWLRQHPISPREDRVKWSDNISIEILIFIVNDNDTI
jgi:hypothetical protein